MGKKMGYLSRMGGRAACVRPDTPRAPAVRPCVQSLVWARKAGRRPLCNAGIHSRPGPARRGGRRRCRVPGGRRRAGPGRRRAGPGWRRQANRRGGRGGPLQADGHLRHGLLFVQGVGSHCRATLGANPACCSACFVRQLGLPPCGALQPLRFAVAHTPWNRPTQGPRTDDPVVLRCLNGQRHFEAVVVIFLPATPISVGTTTRAAGVHTLGCTG